MPSERSFITKAKSMLFALVFLTGGYPASTHCESDKGVTHSAIITRLPTASCVHKILTDLEGVRRVNPMIMEQKDEVKVGDFLCQFGYEGDKYWAYLSIKTRPEEKGWFLQEMVTVGRPPSRDKVEATRRVMRLVEKRLAAQCGVLGLEPSSVTEVCKRVRCD